MFIPKGILQRRELENKRSELENGQAEGSNIIIEDSAQESMEISFEGDTFQNSYEGYNLLNLTNKNEVNLNFPTSYSNKYLYFNENLILNPDNYTIVFKGKAENLRFNKLYFKDINDEALLVWDLYTNFQNTYNIYLYNFKLENPINCHHIMLQSVVAGDFSFKDFMILKGTYTLSNIPNYEPYVGRTSKSK